MFNYHVTFGSPWYLALLVLLPALWWFSLRKLALLGRVRRMVVIALRTIVMLLLVLALAEVQMVRTSDRLTVIFLLDQSLSIPEGRRLAMIDHVNKVIREQLEPDDRVGVVVFGRDAAIEIPPFDEKVQILKVESPLDPDYTNLAAAMKLAQASFPEDAAKRIVLVSDGNQNLGNVFEQAQGVSAAGIGIDVLRVPCRTGSDVIVERLTIPAEVRQGEPFRMNVVVTNTAEPTAGSSGEARGRLVLSELAGGEPVEIEDRPTVLKPGKNIIPFSPTIGSPDFYTYEAKFIPDPDRPEDDTIKKNNEATAFTHVRGKGKVLLIENYETPGEFDHLKDRLEQPDVGLNVTKLSSNQLFSSLAELQPYDTVVLANVPRVTGEGNDVTHFTDDQIRMLVRNTQQMGAGLVMLGGPNSFGAGGWTGTELEKVMPVDFQIKAAKVAPKGALVMIMHACEIPQGNRWQKVVAHEAIKAMGGQDYCGLIHWNGTDQWLWGQGLLPVGGNRNRMMAAVNRMTPGDMPQFDPGMKMALNGFLSPKVADASVKHMIIISDGDPSPPSGGVLTSLRDIKVTISTVAVGAHGPAGSGLLDRIAKATGGKYYNPQDPRALPRIFQREARKVARPLIWDKHPVQPEVRSPHEMITGIEGPLPKLGGFVLTSKKDNPLVDTLLVAPEAAGERNSTILASWTYGLGRAVAFTSDAGARWTADWTDLDLYDELFGTMIRWSMRPTADSANFTVATEVEDEQVRVVVTALDEQDEFVNFLRMTGNVVGPDLEPIPLEMQQTAPGRYVGAFPPRDAGSYLINITSVSPKADGQEKVEVASIRTGVNLPYSDEFRDRQTNDGLLAELARMKPKGGKQGLLIKAEGDSKLLEALLAAKTFHHRGLPKATSSQDVWYYLALVCSCLFFFDVFFRRVQVSFAWVPWLVGELFGRQVERAEIVTMERLRSRKAEVAGQIEQLRADARFEPPPETAVDAEIIEEPARPPTPAKVPTIAGEEKPEEESYTERLLRAKKKVWDERGGKDQA